MSDHPRRPTPAQNRQGARHGRAEIDVARPRIVHQNMAQMREMLAPLRFPRGAAVQDHARAAII